MVQLQLLTFFLVILGNFGLKVVDDILDEPVFDKYKSKVMIFLGPLFIAALLIFLDPEGFLITGSFLLSAPFRGKADNKTFKIAIGSLIGSFAVVYLLSFFEILTLPFFEPFIDLEYILLFAYFILAIVVGSRVYDQLEPFFHFFLSTQKQGVVIIGELIIAIIPFHLLILPIVYPLNLLSPLAFLASIGSFIAYGLAEVVMTKALFNTLSTESQNLKISPTEFARTSSSYDSKILLDLSLVAAARSMGSKGVAHVLPDIHSLYFVESSTPHYLIRIASNMGIPFREFICRRSILVRLKLMEVMQLEEPPELIIHVSGGYSSYFFDLLRHGEDYHKKTYVLTDLEPVLEANKQAQERFYTDWKKNFSGELPQILNLKFDITTDDLVEILSKNGLDPRKKRPLIILEGVLYYFEKSTQIRLLNQLIEILLPLNGFLIVDLQSEVFASLFLGNGFRSKIAQRIAGAFIKSVTANFHPIKEHELLELSPGFQVVNSGIFESLSFVSNLSAPGFKEGSFNVLLLS
ncbi:MAG: hypothetical protein ACFFC7_31555, partial [Candidatus Hermodarchaeota archaeon]